MKKHLRLLTVILCLLIILISGTYAFYGARLTKTGTNTVSIGTKKLGLEFVDGPSIVLDNILPGQKLIKTFTVTNTGTVAQTYHLSFIDVINELSRNDDLVYTLTSTNGGGTSSETVFPTEDGYLAPNITIAPNTTQEYTLIIEYKNLDADQSVDMNSHINATIQIDTDLYRYTYEKTTVGIETITAPVAGRYQIEAWGAQGATSSYAAGGYGGYAVGEVTLDKDDQLSIVVGGQGDRLVDGYNGGGTGGSGNGQTGYAGGGATHVAIYNENYTTLNTYVNTATAVNYVYIVAGGGGGAGQSNEASPGGNGGGASGTNGYDGHNRSYTRYNGSGATQTTAGTSYECGSRGSFGQGSNFCNSGYGGSGGGGGWYGGGGSTRGHGGGGGGSGYLNTTYLSNAKMVCIGCTPDSTPATLTEAKNCHNATATPECAKEGNGAVKITYLGL